MLDPVRAVVARYDEPHRIAIEHRQVGAVHPVGDHHLAVGGVVDVKRLDKVAPAQQRQVQAVEGDLLRGALHLGARQDVLQRHADPARIAHRAVGELPAGHARVEQRAAVAGALVDGDEFDRLELRAQVGHRQVERLARGVAADLDHVLVGVDRRRDAGVVIADEERVVGRDQAVVEDLERRLELGRPRGQHDQRALLGEGDEIAMPVGHRQIQAGSLRDRRAAESTKAGGGDAGTSGEDEPATQAVARRVRHAGSLSGDLDRKQFLPCALLIAARSERRQLGNEV